ncbi:unnamed protein product [marine sediment metagenome]|uniref:Sulfotransferase domain-containing protein n=1 Tax=marine sediment metagenome TaxID=412755 RepID=X1TN39_9ZZZZ
MLDDPFVQVRRMCQFLNVSVSDEAVSWIVSMGDKERLRQIEATYCRPRPAPVPFLRKGEKEQWIEELSAQQLNFIHGITEGAMKKCGYYMLV